MIKTIDKNYQQDLDNFLTWFKWDIDSAEEPYVFIIQNLLTRLRASPGIEESIGFVNDIIDHTQLSMAFINIYGVRPGVKTRPGTLKIWNTSWDRHCILCIPQANRARICYDGQPDQSLGSSPFIMATDHTYQFDNSNSPNSLIMLHIGFETNPAWQTVVDQFSLNNGCVQ